MLLLKSRNFYSIALSNGMAKNFDVLTGIGLRDRVNTRTFNVCLLLVKHLELIRFMSNFSLGNLIWAFIGNYIGKLYMEFLDAHPR